MRTAGRRSAQIAKVPRIASKTPVRRRLAIIPFYPLNDEVMKKMRSSYASDDLEAFALPILAHL